MSPERRNDSGRIELDQSATLTNSDGLQIDVIFRDLSRSGFRISHGGEDLVVGDIMTLTSGRGVRATGQVRWSNKEEAGGVFLDPPECPAVNVRNGSKASFNDLGMIVWA
jgi:hypothetical protein